MEMPTNRRINAANDMRERLKPSLKKNCDAILFELALAYVPKGEAIDELRDRVKNMETYLNKRSTVKKVPYAEACITGIYTNRKDSKEWEE